MAVTLTDHRTIINEADANTGWTGATNLFTTDPTPVEATGCLGAAVNTATLDAYATITAVDLSNKLVYVWVRPFGTMDTYTNGGVGIYLSDGTDSISFHRAGSDLSVFRHETGPTEWQCLVMDTTTEPPLTTVRAGSLVNLTKTAITRVGATFKTLAKAIGGVSNCFIDIMRYGDPTLNNGCMITITGGTSGDPGTFAQIALEDRVITNQRAHGIIRELGTGSYGVQGPIRFGNSTGTASSWFEDKNVTVTFESRNLGTSRYKFYITDNGVGTTTFKLGDKVGSGVNATGANGCNLIAPSGVGAEFDSQTDTDVTNVFVYGSTISGFTNGIKMNNLQEFIGGKITLSGTFIPNGALVYNNEISASTSNVAMEVNNVAIMNNVVGCSFTNNNVAIRINTAGTYTFDGLLFTGNTYDVQNASTGNVIINASNGSNVATFININGGNTTIVNAKTFTVTNIIENSEVRLIRQSDNTELGGVENVSASPTGLNNVSVDADPDNAGRYRVTYSYGYASDVPIWVVVFNVDYLPIYQNSALRATNSSLLVSQIGDRQYDRGTIFNPG